MNENANEMKQKNQWCRDWGRFSPLAIIGMVIGGLGLAVLIAFGLGWLVMYLWNWLMPDIFGLPVITFWQAWGLVVLSHILIKPGYGHGGSGGKSRHRKEKGFSCDKNDGWRTEVKERFTATDKEKE